MLDYFSISFQAILYGFIIAAPVGPIGILCIQRTLSNGLRSGLFTGLGAATADAIFACLAAFGLTAVTYFLIEKSNVITLAGGIFLIYLGIRVIWSHPKLKLNTKRVLKGDFISTFILTLTNPMTIIIFIALFSNLLLLNNQGDSFSLGIILVVGIFAGSFIWWLLLCSIVMFFKSRINDTWLGGINLISGGIIIIFGLVFITKAIKPMLT